MNKRNMCPEVTVVSISKRERAMQPRGNYLISPLLSPAFGTLLSPFSHHAWRGDDGAQLAAGRRMASVMQIGG